MAKKRNKELRAIRDFRARKSMTDGKTWVEKLLEELQQGVEPEEEAPAKRRKGKREQARRLTNTSL